MNKFDKLPALYYLGFYHPKFDYYEDCYYDNCNFNEFSHRILTLKSRGYAEIYYFRDILTKLIEDEEISIVAVPSHIALESNSGIRDLASFLVKSKKNYIDAVKCLERVVTVGKYSLEKGCRSEQEHFNSIVIKDRILIEDKNVILMDDVLTSGNSANACKRLLLNAGAKEVKILCLGKTIRGEAIDRVHDVIEENVREFILYTDIHAENNINNIKKRYHNLFCHLAQELDEDDEEGLFTLECTIGSEEKEELDTIDYSIDYEKSEYSEYANEAHRALHGEGYLTPDNPLIQFL
jgi:hypoxanthine phosphoribosyltransferase